MHDKILKYSAGVDMSGNDFKACFSQIGPEQRAKVNGSRTFSNTLNGYRAFDTWLKKHRKQSLTALKVTVEATGIYHEKLAYFLYRKGYDVCVVLPNRSKKYMEPLGLKSKTDKLDAKGLAQMGAEQALKQWQPFSDHIYELKTLTRHRSRIQKMITRARNQIHAHENMGHVTKPVVRQLKQMLKAFDKQLVAMEKEIEKVLQKDEKIAAGAKRVAGSINGVGLMTVVTLLKQTGSSCFRPSPSSHLSVGTMLWKTKAVNVKAEPRFQKRGTLVSARPCISPP